MKNYQKGSERSSYHKSNYVKTIPEWNNIKNLVWERDDSTCQSCGKKPSGQVHHIVARRSGGSNDLVNLVTLCGKCHMLVSPVPNHIIAKVWKIPIQGVNYEREKVEEKLTVYSQKTNRTSKS